MSLSMILLGIAAFMLLAVVGAAVHIGRPGRHRRPETAARPSTAQRVAGRLAPAVQAWPIRLATVPARPVPVIPGRHARGNADSETAMFAAVPARVDA